MPKRRGDAHSPRRATRSPTNSKNTRWRSSSPFLSGEQSIERFLAQLQHRNPHTSFRFDTLLAPLTERYGNMRKLVGREVERPSKLEKEDGALKRDTSGAAREDQTGQRCRFDPALWEYLKGQLEENGDPRMPAGAQHLFANAVVNWCLSYVKQR